MKIRIIGFLGLAILAVTLAGCGGGNGSFTLVTANASATPSLVVQFTPSAVNQIVAGGIGDEFGTLTLNATTASEDVSVPSVSLALVTSGGAEPADLTTLQLFNGRTPLNTGSATANPTTSRVIVVFDSPVVITKGTSKTFTIKANVATRTPVGASFQLGVAGVMAFGVTSNTVLAVSVSPTTVTATPITIVQSALGFSIDSSSPSYQQVVGGTTNVSVLVSKFRSMGETMSLEIIDLVLLSGRASDLQQVTVWAGNTKIGSAVFTGTSTHASATLSERMLLPRDTDVPLTIRADTTFIGRNQPGQSGEFVQLAVVGAHATGNDSGSTITATGLAGGAGFRTYKSVPRLTLDNLPSTGVADGKLMRFWVQAHPAGDVSLDKFSFRVVANSCNVTNVNLFCYTDNQYSSAVSSFQNGQMMAMNATLTSSGLVTIYPETSSRDRTAVVIPAGMSRFFELRGSVTANGVSYSVAPIMMGDSFPLPPSGMSSVPEIDGHGANFIWSDNSLSDASRPGDLDWTSGFGVNGLPSGGLQLTRTN